MEEEQPEENDDIKQQIIASPVLEKIFLPVVMSLYLHQQNSKPQRIWIPEYLRRMPYTGIPIKITIKKDPEEPKSERYLVKKENCRKVLDALCDGYLIMLPKLMGCLLCQYAHSMASSQRHLHYQERKEQLLFLKKIVAEEDYNPEAFLNYLEKTMGPFNGEFGKDFSQQCTIILKGLIELWE